MGRKRHLGKSERKTNKSHIGITIIFIILSIVALYFTIINFKNIKDEKDNNKKLNIKYDEIKSIKIAKLNEQKELTDAFTEAENIDKVISDTKEEVFKLAKQVETRIINNETKYKIAYITFDDGPYHLTDKVLAKLKEKKVKATFFTIGQDKDTCYDNRSYSCKETYKKIVDNGHTIANHTYSHAIFNGLYASQASFINQVKKQEQLIKERTGVTTNILRFPGGSATAKALAGNSVNGIMNELKQNGYGWVDWTAADGDGGYLNSYEIGWKNLTSEIDENIEVILFHDYNYTTYSLLGNAIDYLENKNYILLPLFHDSIKVNK